MDYDDFQGFALEHYEHGGDVIVETWGIDDFEEEVRKNGPMTVKRAYELFRMYNSQYRKEKR